MKSVKKIIAVALVLVMSLGIITMPSYAQEPASFPEYTVGENIEHGFYRSVDKLISVIVGVLNFFLPGTNWTGKYEKLKNYKTENFYAGEDRFDTEVKQGAHWKAGYSSLSLLDGIDPLDGSYWLAGSLEVFKGRVPVKVLDDQRVYAYALSDGVSGTVVHAVVDAFGIARGDVAEIRKRLSSFAEENGIVSVDISVLHQHSCIDTLGMAAPLVPALFVNPAATLFDKGVISGRNKVFIEKLYGTVTDAMKSAVKDMEGGQLYMGSVDVSEYMYDKREPLVVDPDLVRLRFIPDNESSDELWICEAGIHCVGLGAAPDRLTSDFPYYLKQYIKNVNGADVVYVQGSELAITADYEKVQYDESRGDVEKLKTMGTAIAKEILSIENDIPLEPVLNVTHREVKIKPDNQILVLAVREGLFNSVVAKDGISLQLITEIGYMELGNKVGIFMIPGEMAPEIIYGGAADKNLSWTGDTWDYAPLAKTAGIDRIMCFGLCNDQIGYILCDNDFRSILTENEEILASSSKSGSVLAGEFEKLLSDIK